jgi:hypothetical protein
MFIFIKSALLTMHTPLRRAVEISQHIFVDILGNRTKMGFVSPDSRNRSSLTKMNFKGSLSQGCLFISATNTVRPKHFDVKLFFRFYDSRLWTSVDKAVEKRGCQVFK